MGAPETQSFWELVSVLEASAEEVSSLGRNSVCEREIFTEMATLLDKLMPILVEIKNKNKVMDKPPILKALQSLEIELRRAKALIENPYSESIVQKIEDVTQNLGRSLGLVQFGCFDVSRSIKDKIGVVRKELMNARFDVCFSPSLELMKSGFGTSLSPSSPTTPNPSRGSVFNSDLESENEIEEERINLSTEDVLVQLKYGNDEEFRLALVGLSDFIRDRVVDSEWISDERVIPVLFNRLASSNPHDRMTIIQILRVLASENAENKEKMADTASLSALVSSLKHDVIERREALELLLDLSEISIIRKKAGRIQGCIVMLVAIFKGDDDPHSSHVSGKLLSALSGNNQNALHMAEAGFYQPLVHFLTQGSDMTKILMATALSKMELTDEGRLLLGEDGAIDPLVKMFISGKLEAKLSALNALQNLSNLTDNIQRLIESGIIVPLLQLLFSVTSVLMTLREPASAILAKIAKSESILMNHDVAQQMLSLLNLSSPVIQCHLLEAINSICSHSSASKVRKKIKENGGMQILLPFLNDGNIEIRTSTLNLLHTLSKDSRRLFAEQIGETYLNTIVIIISSATLDSEKATAAGILRNILIGSKNITDTLKKSNLLPVLISIMNSTTTSSSLAENVAGVLTRFTVSSDKKLQLLLVELGIISILVKLLSTGSVVTKRRAATSLSQLSQSTLDLIKSRKSRWMCMPATDSFCEVHNCHCVVKTTFCLVKAGAVSPLIKILEGQEREADEAVLEALATLLQDKIWESGSKYIAKKSAVEGLLRVIELGDGKARKKALWILERILRIEEYRARYGEAAKAVLVDVAEKCDSPAAKATVLAQLEMLQVHCCNSSFEILHL